MINFAVDTTPPTVQSCPFDIITDIELGAPGIPVYWNEPSAVDLSNTTSLVSQSFHPGQQFEAGTTDVTYKFADASGNEASCVFSVIGREGKIIIHVFHVTATSIIITLSF